jgi:choline kinase
MPSAGTSAPLRAVILAAGDGGRLEHLTASLPKPLVQVAGRPLIAYTFDALSENGVTEILVITGYRERELRMALRESHLAAGLRFASNPRFREGSALSLRAARDFSGSEPFLLLMADHMFSGPLIARLLGARNSHPGECIVAADSAGAHDPAYVAEATCLRVDGLAVAEIGKDLRAFDALDTGAFVLTDSVWGALDTLSPNCELSDVCRELIRRRELIAADVSGTFWYDVDTPEDLVAAESLIAARASA